MIGNEEDFTACLGMKVEGLDENISKIDVEAFEEMIKNSTSPKSAKNLRYSIALEAATVLRRASYTE